MIKQRNKYGIMPQTIVYDTIVCGFLLCFGMNLSKNDKKILTFDLYGSIIQLKIAEKLSWKGYVFYEKRDIN